jgi:NAD(P)-dependent dehydrogenase (short-subunit alcohol dehydrogenase family)
MTSIVLITGANKGIGFATARHLATAGHTVLLGARNPHQGRAAAAELGGAGLDAHFIHLDVTDQVSIDAAAQRIDTDHGRLDILVNNAAISRERPLTPSQLPATVYREVLETNVIGVVAIIHAMLPLLRRSAHAVIGNVSSGLGTMAFLTDTGHPHRRYANLLAYNSSKAALNAVTLIYAHELASAGIRVNALSPGFCATDLNGHRGTLTADEGGAHIARQVLQPEVTGVFLHENGGTYPW